MTAASPTHKRRNDRPVERRCIVSREVRPRESLIRFVLDPDNRVVPDIAGRLPGRGAWVGAERERILEAVRRQAFARSFRCAVETDAGLADRTEAALARSCAGLLGLARRAGEAVCGYEKTRAALAEGGGWLCLLAHDAAENARDKARQMARGHGMIEVMTNTELSLALGRENVVHAALAPGGLAERFRVEAARLQGLRSKVEAV